MSPTNPVRRRLVEKFRSLARERLHKLNNALLQLEQTPDDTELANDAQREIHTLKGEAHILGFMATSRVAHQIEDLLRQGRTERFERRELTDTILAGFDTVGALVDGLGVDGEPDIDTAEFDARVAQMLTGTDTKAAPKTAAAPKPNTERTLQSFMAVQDDSSVRVELSKLEQLTQIVGDLRVGHAHAADLTDSLAEMFFAVESAIEDDRSASGKRRSQQRQMERLRARLRAVEEFHEALRSRLHHALTAARDNGFADKGRLDRLTAAVRELRMLPLASLFQRYPRAVRDLARSLDKEAHLSVSGADIEVDKRVLDELHEPLLHLIRNSIDHGIESAKERKKAHKPPLAEVSLAAHLHGARVEIVLRDDGRGIDTEMVRRVAIEQRLLSPEGAEATTDEGLLELLFTPDFSTRKKVTDISGRGVGLDVVKQRITALGGSVHIETQKGQGTAFHLSVPISVTMSRALVVEAGGGRYAFPADSVVTATALGQSNLESAGLGSAFRFDGDPVPLADLGTMLADVPAAPTGDETRPVVVIEHDGRRQGLWVERFVGARQVLQEPPGKFLEDSHLVRSTAVLETGEVAVALHLPALFAAAAAPTRHSALPTASIPTRGPGCILVVDDSELTRDMVVSMLRDARYEVLEAVNGREAMQRLAKRAPDLIITDLQMPVLDGFGLLREVRTSKLWSDIPMLVFSTLGAEADKKQAASLGADAYLVKSELRKELLLETVGRFVGEGRAAVAS